MSAFGRSSNRRASSSLFGGATSAKPAQTRTQTIIPQFNRQNSPSVNQDGTTIIPSWNDQFQEARRQANIQNILANEGLNISDEVMKKIPTDQRARFFSNIDFVKKSDLKNIQRFLTRFEKNAFDQQVEIVRAFWENKEQFQELIRLRPDLFRHNGQNKPVSDLIDNLFTSLGDSLLKLATNEAKKYAVKQLKKVFGSEIVTQIRNGVVSRLRTALSKENRLIFDRVMNKEAGGNEEGDTIHDIVRSKLYGGKLGQSLKVASDLSDILAVVEIGAEVTHGLLDGAEYVTGTKDSIKKDRAYKDLMGWYDNSIGSVDGLSEIVELTGVPDLMRDVIGSEVDLEELAGINTISDDDRFEDLQIALNEALTNQNRYKKASERIIKGMHDSITETMTDVKEERNIYRIADTVAQEYGFSNNLLNVRNWFRKHGLLNPSDVSQNILIGKIANTMNKFNQNQ